MSREMLFAGAVLMLSVAHAGPASAYVGPGAGLTAIGSVLAFFGVILLMIIGFFWYPLKRMFAGRGSNAADGEAPKTDIE